MKLLFAGWLLFPALVGAQPATDANRFYEIQGRVVDADTGAAISRARVSLTLSRVGDQSGQPIEPVVLLTDPSGSFRIANLPSGYANLSCDHAGYFGPDPPRTAGTMVALLNIKDSAVAVTLYLSRQAVIRGTALDERGLASNGMVQAYRLTLIDGRLTPQQAASANVDMEGNFRLTGLKPGRYYVAHFPNSSQSRPMHRVYRPIVYPASRDLAGARTITVTSGDDRQIDFRPTSEPAFEISGKIPAGAENFSVSVRSTEPSGLPNPQFFGSVPSNDLDRTFQSSALPSGQYTVKAQWMIGEGWIRASKKVAITGANLTDLVFEAGAPDTLPISLTYDPAANPEARAYVQLVSRAGNYSASPNDHGNLAVGQLAPGLYAVLVTGIGYAKSAQQGGRDALREGVLVPEEGSPEPLEIVIGNQSASFETTLDPAAAKPGEVVRIAYLRQTPIGLHLEQQTSIAAPLNSPERFTRTMSYAEHPAPGEYIIIAWTGDGTINQIPYNEPGFIDRYASLIERATLGDTGHPSVIVHHLLPPSAFEAN